MCDVCPVPLLTVVIPVYREGAGLHRNISVSLALLDHAGEYTRRILDQARYRSLYPVDYERPAGNTGIEDSTAGHVGSPSGCTFMQADRGKWR